MDQYANNFPLWLALLFVAILFLYAAYRVLMNIPTDEEARRIAQERHDKLVEKYRQEIERKQHE